MTRHRTLRLPLLVVLLLATLAVSGTGERAPSESAVSERKTGPVEDKMEPSAAEPAPGADPAKRQTRLDLARLDRSAPGSVAVDIFASKSWVPPPPPPPPQKAMVSVPAAPVAPPLPFAYAGKLEYPDGKLIVYLTKGETVYTASTGDTVDTNYRLESVGEGQLVFTYLPLKTQQVLAVPQR
jgi:hypothetical protein